MKKMLSVALSMVFLVSLLIVPVWTVGAAAEQIYEDTLYFEENFDGHVGVVDDSFTPTVGKVAAIAAEVVKDTTKNSDVLKVDGNGKRYTVQFVNSQYAKSKIAVEFDFMAQSTVNTNGMTGLIMLEANNSSQSENLAWWLTKDGSVLRAPGVAAVTGTDFAGKWYSARVLYDINTGLTEWYVAEYGQELTLKGTNTRLITEENRGKVNRLNIQNCSGFYLDNLKVYEYITKDGAKDLITQAEQTLASVDVVTPPLISYTSEAKAALSSAIAAAKAAVEAATTAAELNAAADALRAAYQTFLGSGVQDYTTVFEGNFSAEGNLTGNYFLQYGTIEPATDPTSAGRTNVAKLTPTDASYGARLLKNGTISGNQFMLKSSFMQTTKAAAEQALFLFAGGNNEQHEVLAIYTDGTDIYLRYSDNAIGYATSVTAKTAKLVENYAAHTWYDFEAKIDFATRTIMLYINGAPVLTDRTLYITGSSAASGGSYRACVWNKVTDMYIADMGMYQDTSSGILSVFSNLGKQFTDVTGNEEYHSLPATIDGYAITWASDDFEVANTVNHGLAAYPTYLASASTGELTATITIGGTAYSSSYYLPVAAAPAVETVIDHHYDVAAGTAVDAIDSAYWSAVGSLPTVTTLAEREGGVLLLNGQRFLYTVPEASRIADIAVLEMDIMMPEKAAANNEHVLMLGNISGAVSVQLKLTEDDIVLVPGDYRVQEEFPESNSTEWSVPILEDYEPNTWYKLTVIQNFITRTYKILVDGQPTLDNMNITMATPVRNVGRISFYGGAESKFYMDNLKVYDADLTVIAPHAATEEVQVNRYAPVDVPIYPLSKTAEGMILADAYSYSIAGENTEDLSITRGGVLVVPATAAVGTVATVTATSKYDSQLTTTTTVTITGGLSKKFEILEGETPLETPQDALSTSINAKITLVNDAAIGFSGGFIAAAYQGGALIDADAGEVNNLSGTDAVPINLELPEDKTGVEIKIFCFDSFTNLKPLQTPVVFAAKAE